MTLAMLIPMIVMVIILAVVVMGSDDWLEQGLVLVLIVLLISTIYLGTRP